MRLIGHSRHYGEKPSETLGIAEEYAAFCLDEACAYIWSQMTGDNPKKPCFGGKSDDLIGFLRERKGG